MTQPVPPLSSFLVVVVVRRVAITRQLQYQHVLNGSLPLMKLLESLQCKPPHRVYGACMEISYIDSFVLATCPNIEIKLPSI